MSKKRRTKKQKLNTEKRRQNRENSGFKIDNELLKVKTKKVENLRGDSFEGKGYLVADLTKTLLLTMLAVALELALWKLFR